MDDDEVEWVDLAMSPEELAEYCRTHDEWTIHLDQTWTAESLGELYRRHLASPFASPDVIGEIANDERAPAWVLSDIVTRFWTDRVMMIGVAVNPAAGSDVVTRLTHHEDGEVRRKAHRALREQRGS